MLYVFHVDTGTMLTFDMNLAMESVATLQGVIARACHITEDKQVLLISGGESLDPSARVGKYHAGTDTNPIFLFSKSTIEAMTPPSPSVHYGSDVDIHSQVEGSLLLPPAYATVVSRAQLALQIHDVDKEEMKACEKLVHDQHLQQQGWAAVVANLEDITSALHQRSEIFMTAYQEYLVQREDYRETLSRVVSSLQLLSKIPVLPVLLSEVSFLSEDAMGLIGSDEDNNGSLYDWISSQDPQHNLNDMVDQCMKATEQLDPRIQESLTSEVQSTLKQVDNLSMKEVKGLEDRLYGLDQMMSVARRLVQEQSDMAQGFIQNQNRVSNLRDKSILPDLCSSHKKQLLVMVNNHKMLRDKKKKCKMAKEELAVNLHTRLRWVMWVEKMICDVDGKLMIYHENLKRLRKRLDILRQIYEAPRVYAQLVVEVVRRKKFASFFTKWAVTVADDYNSVHSEEVKRRQTFQSEVGHHFLQTLFQGLEDVPVTVISKTPSDFDKNLPNITSDDITMLKEAVPELAEELKLPFEAALPVGTTDITKSKFPQLFKHNSIVTSEIEIIHSLDDQYLTCDRDSVSLGEQVANSELDTNLVIKSENDTDQLKPELLMPRSLSEDLTQQMKGEVSDDSNEGKEASRGAAVASVRSPTVKREQVTLKTSGEASGASTSSGEQIKSTESDSSGQDNAQHSGEEKSCESAGRKIMSRRKVGAELSPDMETSQEFTTADFYIEDSMPSSIADSPPTCSKPGTVKPSAEKLSENKAAYLEKLEKENIEFKARNSVVSSKLKTFQEYVNIHLPEMKSSLSGFQTTYVSSQMQFQDEFESNKKKILETLQQFDAHRSEEERINIEKHFADSEKIRNDLEEKLKQSNIQISAQKEEVENLQRDLVIAKEDVTLVRKTSEEKVSDLSLQLSEMCKVSESEKSRIADLERQTESLKQQSNEMEDRAKETKEKLENDLSKAKENYDVEVSELTKRHSLEMEVELDKLRAEMQLQIDELEKIVSEKEKLLKEMEGNLKKAEKENILLEEKMMEKFQTEKDGITKIMEEDFEQRMDKKIEEEKEALSKQFQQERETLLGEHQSGIENLSKQLVSEKEEEVEKIRKELEEKHEKSETNIRTMLEKEKDADLEKQKSVLTEDYQKEMGTVRDELLQEKATLLLELKAFRDKVMEQKESQTEVKESKPLSVQTEPAQVTGKETQTPAQEVTQSQSQTDKTQLAQQQIQTEVFEGTHTESQTEAKEVKTGVSQTKTVVLAQGETQTAVKEYLPKEAQTKIHSYAQGEAQTDLKAMEQQTDSSSGLKLVGNVLSREEHEDAVREVEKRLRELQDQALGKALTNSQEKTEFELNALKEQHDQEISSLIAKFEKDRDDSASSLKTSLTAEKQMMFNEAVSKVTQEKDKVIESLRQEQTKTLEQQHNYKDTIEKLKEEKAKLEDMKTRAMSHLNDKDREFAACKRQMESEVALVRQQLTEYQTQLQPASHMQVSASPSVMNISTTEDKESRICELEEAMKSKEDEITSLQQKLSEFSMTASTRSVVQDKVSITSCTVGDLVLFCLDERHDQYVVFTIGTTLHFLHTDCLDNLGLRTNPGETRKSWVLAEITEKEYCQAKKPMNRFKVPVGTKFYRVKAKQWTREGPQTGAVGGASNPAIKPSS
ncbi:RB1-inducible coiled-coil protein 1-like [Mizuhopecten yessoensis]|uniref:RB1-inducible coiled-coil protein 1-like n=1 Tax=Mizuhopecten yessoensis TaxID=6573 RepID=UPI000B45C146|nr:RB1-inducible coiled-coil protein 1-like [Mizuhopecten yessoensis]